MSAEAYSQPEVKVVTDSKVTWMLFEFPALWQCFWMPIYMVIPEEEDQRLVRSGKHVCRGLFLNWVQGRQWFRGHMDVVWIPHIFAVFWMRVTHYSLPMDMMFQEEQYQCNAEGNLHKWQPPRSCRRQNAVWQNEYWPQKQGCIIPQGQTAAARLTWDLLALRYHGNMSFRKICHNTMEVSPATVEIISCCGGNMPSCHGDM